MLSSQLLKYSKDLRRRGNLRDFHGEGWAGTRGRFMRMQVRLADLSVEAATFQTFFCVPSLACGSYLTQWIVGRRPEELAEMTAERLEQELEGLPSERRYCAELAVCALGRALEHATRAAQ